MSREQRCPSLSRTGRRSPHRGPLPRRRQHAKSAGTDPPLHENSAVSDLSWHANSAASGLSFRMRTVPPPLRPHTCRRRAAPASCAGEVHACMRAICGQPRIRAGRPPLHAAPARCATVRAVCDPSQTSAGRPPLHLAPPRSQRPQPHHSTPAVQQHAAATLRATRL